jgi:tRNA-modifying protein YgfZ
VSLQSDGSDLETSFVSPRDVIHAIGADTTKFLQGQLTQSIEAIGIGESRWSLLLQPNGRVIALIRLTRLGVDDILIDTEPGVGDRAHAALSRFLIRTKCTLTLSESVQGFRSTSNGGREGLMNIPCQPWPGTQSLDYPVETAPRIDPGVDTDDSTDESAFASWMIRNGELRHDIELLENTIPSETSVLDVAVVFGKGCYVGQELVERIESRGRVVKALVRLRSDSLFVAGDELLDAELAEETVCGAVTSATEFAGKYFGIGLVRGGPSRSSVRLVNGGSVDVLSLISDHIEEAAV